MSGKHRIMVSNSIHDGQMLVYRRWKASHSKYAFSEALICFPYRIEHDDTVMLGQCASNRAAYETGGWRVITGPPQGAMGIRISKVK